MKNLKRIIALVAVFALALTTFASAASFTDVAEDSVYYRAVEQLHKIGIIDGYTDGTFKPEQTVTRAEMAKLIAAMQGYAESAEGKSATKFSDVPSTHWASGYIASATGTGIDGLPDGTFAPERNVKYEEAVKMIMATLGYTVIANAEGGYPMGYISAAIKEKVTEDVTGANIGSDASRGTIAQLIYNAIDTPLVEQVTWNKDGSGDYIKHDGSEYVVAGAIAVRDYKTLMTENLEIVKGEGVVTYNTYFGMDSSVSTDIEDAPVVGIKIVDTKKVYGDSEGKDYFKNTAEVLVAESDAMEYVGYAVDFYARQNDYDEWEILSILPSETFNKTITFNLSDYDDKESEKSYKYQSGTTTFDKDEKPYDLYYFKDGATNSTKVTLQAYDATAKAPAYMTMFNYKAGLSVSSETPIKAQLKALKNNYYGGQVTLIDNDKFAGYDAVIIEAAVSDVVTEVKRGAIATENRTKLPDGGRFDLDTTDEDFAVLLLKDGEEITAEEVAENDVLSIVARDNALYTVVEVMSNAIEGTVSSTKTSKTSADKTAYKVDGTWYDVAKGATVGVEAGTMGTFYIDKYGKIAYFVEGSLATAGNYAYVIETLLDVDDWGKQAFAMKLLTKDGIVVYNAANKFTIYEATSTKTDVDVETETVKTTIPAGTQNSTLGDKLVGQVIDFSLSGGNVKKVVLPGYERNGEDVIESKGVVGGATVKFDAEDLEIGSTTFDEEAVVFYYNSVDPEKSYVGTLADLEDKAPITSSKCVAYADKNAKEDANILVLVDVLTSTSDSAGLAVVTGYESGSNEEEEDVYVISFLYNGEEVTYTTDADVFAKYDAYVYADGDPTLTIGDVVKIKVTGAGVITQMETIFNFATDDARAELAAFDASAAYKGASAKWAKTPGKDKETFDGGYVTDFNTRNKKVSKLVGGTSGTGSPVDYSLAKADNVYVIDGTGREVEIYVGGSGDFDWDEALAKDAKGTSTEADDVLNTIAPAGSFKDTAKTGANYADVVFFRTYDSDVVDVVIVKGSTDYKLNY